MGNKNYSQSDKQYIVDNASTKSLLEIATHLGRTELSVRSYVSRQKIPTRKDYYSPEEESYIREWAGKKPWHEVASDLGRTERGIQVFASRSELVGSSSLPRGRSRFTEVRTCRGLFCDEAFLIRRERQIYCSTKCEQSSSRIKKYNLSKERWWSIFKSQGSACVCGATSHPKPWTVDHDHSCCSHGSSCGECVRGILCEDCNLALGKVKDSPSVLRALALYLER